ncbi:MAG TPA: DUF4157 domain-containing protein [Roseiflexaceae bacterium]|nr:DUF4157 domain-containing protein [Roseiflexaceae bacterium]
MERHHLPALAEHDAALRRHSDSGTLSDANSGLAQHPLLTLQRQLGNAQVARMLAQRESAEEDEIQAKHDPVQREDEDEIQAKHDPVQREEDDEIQAKHDIQREEEDEVQAKHDIQREGEAVRPEVGLEGGPVSADVSGRINAQRGGGASLDAGTRTSMEGAFGTSFADVRIHHDTESDALNRSISAKAFTTGSDIFFRKDASPSDQGLLAHELTHVVQQRSGAVGGGGGMNVGAAGDSHEQEADAVSAQVTSGSAAQAQREAEQQAVQRALLQREEAAEEEEQM